MKKIYWIILLLIISIAFFGYNYVYQDHRNIENETAIVSLDSNELVGEFQKNMDLAESKYLNKTIEVSGTITEINTSDLTLNDAIFCSFDSQIILNNIIPNSKISIKGRCIGYDELLEQVKLDQCTISQ